MPQALIDFYMEFGKYEFPDGFRCARLLTPGELAIKEYCLKHSSFLVFYIDDWSHLYGVKHKQLEESNPPVYRYNIDRKDYYNGNDGWMLYCSSVQEFLIALTYEKTHFLHQYHSTLYTITTDDLALILKKYKGKGIVLTIYRSENPRELDELYGSAIGYFADSSYKMILKSYGNENHDDSAEFFDIYQQGIVTAFHNNDSSSDIGILQQSTMYFGNYGDSVIVVDGMLMYYSSLSEEHYLAMEKDFSHMREAGSMRTRKRLLCKLL